MDTSCLVAVAFDEPGGEDVARLLESVGTLLSSNLLEAELRAALARERVDAPSELFTWITWVLPDRPLDREIEHALRGGYAKGADLWHVATALYAAELPRDVAFLTLDERQRDLASSLGFPTPLA